MWIEAGCFRSGLPQTVRVNRLRTLTHYWGPPLRRTEAHGQTLHMQHRVQATGCPRLCRRRDAAQPGETPRSAANPDPHLGSEIRGWCAGSAAVDLIAAYEARIARTAGRQADARNRVPIGICCEIGEPAGLPNAWCRHCTWT